MILAIVLAVYAAYLLIGFRPAARPKDPRAVWPCLILFGIGIIIQSLYELKVSVPSPAAPIYAFVSSLFNLK
jgi:hypothetical protein